MREGSELTICVEPAEEVTDAGKTKISSHQRVTAKELVGAQDSSMFWAVVSGAALVTNISSKIGGRILRLRKRKVWHLAAAAGV